MQNDRRGCMDRVVGNAVCNTRTVPGGGGVLGVGGLSGAGGRGWVTYTGSRWLPPRCPMVEVSPDIVTSRHSITPIINLTFRPSASYTQDIDMYCHK